MALALDTGGIVWVSTGLAGDAWNVGCLDTRGWPPTVSRLGRSRPRLWQLAHSGDLCGLATRVARGPKIWSNVRRQPKPENPSWKMQAGQGVCSVASSRGLRLTDPSPTYCSPVRSKRKLAKLAVLPRLMLHGKTRPSGLSEGELLRRPASETAATAAAGGGQSAFLTSCLRGAWMVDLWAYEGWGAADYSGNLDRLRREIRDCQRRAGSRRAA